MDAPVALVKAYLEQCGYFVLTELPLRESIGGGYRDVTDVDIIAVRFPHDPVGAGHRGDPLDLLLGIDPELETFHDGVDVIIAEVKAGKAAVNPALRRGRTIAFALRRLGCCPLPEVPAAAGRILEKGRADLEMGPGLACRVRLVAFAGEREHAAPASITVTLAHCAGFIERQMRTAGAALADAQFKDPVLSLLALLAKAGAGPAEGLPVAVAS